MFGFTSCQNGAGVQMDWRINGFATYCVLSHRFFMVLFSSCMMAGGGRDEYPLVCEHTNSTFKKKFKRPRDLSKCDVSNLLSPTLLPCFLECAQ